MEMFEYATKFHELYQGPPICLWLSGGGYGFLEILKRPGCSRFVHDIVIPYSQEATNRRLLQIKRPTSDQISLCSKEASHYFIEYLQDLYGFSSKAKTFVSVTAALTTDHYRKGENRAFISIVQSGEQQIRTWKLTLFHPNELFFNGNLKYKSSWLRHIEDNKLSLILMTLLTENGDIFHPHWNEHALKEFIGAEETESLVEVT